MDLSNDPVALKRQIGIDLMVESLVGWYDPDSLLIANGLTRSELRKILHDDEIAAAMETRRASVIGTDWHLDKNGAGSRVVQFITRQLDRHITTILHHAWSAVPFGYSVLEVVYQEAAGGGYEWGSIAAPPFEWFRPQANGSLLFFPRFTSSGSGIGYGEAVDTVLKFFPTIRNAAVDRPMGEALLGHLYLAWLYRISGWESWARFLEKHGSPTLIGKTLRDPAKLAAVLEDAVNSSVVAVHKDDEVQALSVSNTGESFNTFNTAVEKRIQKLILGQTLTTDIGSTGSYAAASVHNEVRMDRRLSDCLLLTGTVNRMIEALVMLNFPNSAIPRFVMEDGRGLDQERAARDKILTEAGMVKFTPTYIVNNYDLKEEDFTLPNAPAAPAPAGATGIGGDQPAGAGGAGFALNGASGEPFAPTGHRFTPEQQLIENLADSMLAQMPEPIPSGAIRFAIENSADPNELALKLADLVPNSDPFRFRQLLERALFAADVMGYSNGGKL